MPILKHFSLRQLNTFGVDARAAEYAVFADAAQLRACIRSATRTPWILGGGSNLLFSGDIDRCVLHNEIGGIEIIEQNGTEALVRVGAGVTWHDFVNWCVDRDLGGIENLALIPGRVGAAPIQNIGAYGVELRDVFVSLHAMDLLSGEITEYDTEASRFGYRDSIFKSALKDRCCVLDITLRLSKSPHKIQTEYGAIRDVLSAQGISAPGIAQIRDAVISIRASKLPDPATIGNAGSFFKNPVADASAFASLSGTYPHMPAYPAEDGAYKIPAGWLIEQCGWKGKRVGNVGCYEKQALVIVNYGGASGSEIWDHAMRVQESVRSRFGILLEPEVNVIR